MHTIDTYAVDGPQATWASLVSLLLTYVAVWWGGRLSPIRAAVATLVAFVASTLVGAITADALISVAPASVPLLLVVTVSRAIMTVVEALIVGYGFRGGMTWRLLGCLAAANVIDATVSFLETINSRNA